MYDFQGKNIKYEGQVVFWWRNKALTTSLTAPNNHCLFGWGDGWEWKQVCSGVRGRSGLRAMTPSIYQTVGPNTFPAGNPVIAAPTVAPQYPTGKFHWGGSCWVNGTTNRIPSVGGLTPQPFNADAAGTSHVTALNANPTIDGNWTYYYVITTPSGYTSPIALLHSEGNQNIDIRINVGGGISFDIDGIGSAATGSSILNPDPNSPSILSIRIDESNSKIIWGLYRSGESVRRSQQDLTGYTSANPLIFDDLGVTTAGFDLFGRVVSSNPTTRTITELAPPDFTVHEIMCYPTLLNDNQDHNVLQWLENKYGIDV